MEGQEEKEGGGKESLFVTITKKKTVNALQD